MRLKTVCMTVCGFLLLALAAIGLLIPVWPTTPFLIASAACLTVTPRLRARLNSLPLLGDHLRNYHERTGLSRATVAVSLSFLYGMLFLSCLLTQNAWVVLLLCCIAVAVTVHILYMARPKAAREKILP